MRVVTCQPTLHGLRSAVRDLAVAGEGRARCTFVVLGEVPGAAPEELMDLGRLLVRLGISTLVAVGAAGPVHAGAVLEGSWGEESRHVAGPDEALAVLRTEVGPDDAVLVAGLPEVLAGLGVSA